MQVAVVIPAQETNKYHIEGDLAPFGDTTLLEWKISQCIECFETTDIFITTDSFKVHSIAEEVGINVLLREKNISYSGMILNTIKKIDAEHIMWINPTSPFINSIEYKKMIDAYILNCNKYDSLVTTSMKKDFIYYNDSKLNFDKHTLGRSSITPVYLATNGVYINSKKNILENNELIGNKPLFYNLDFLESLEIKDTQTYSILRELISLYFIKELDV